MPRQVPPPASRPVAWALLSQALWLPLLAVDLQDRWSSRVETFTPRPGGSSGTLALLSPQPAGGGSLAPAQPPSASGLTNSGLLLGSGPLGRAPGTAADAFAPTPAAAAGFRGGLSGSPVPTAPTTGTALALKAGSGAPSALALSAGGFSRAELLGGPITLADLQEGSMPPMALAERGRLSLSGDPLAALPEPWREPMRRALATLPAASGPAPRLNQARHVHVPSSRISRSTEVPLALQSDGSVDILSRPETEAVVEEIRDWSARQTPPSEGSIAPALVHLHPVGEAEPLRPSAADLSGTPPPAAAPVAPPVATKPISPAAAPLSPAALAQPSPQPAAPSAASEAGTVR